jgi:hypothetical protein
MLVRPKLAGPWATLVACVPLFLSGCSSSQPHDINNGTDVGLEFVPPDASATSHADTTPSAAEVSAYAYEVIADSANAVDGGMSVDSSIDAEN